LLDGESAETAGVTALDGRRCLDAGAGACFGFAGILPLGDLEAEGDAADAIAGVDGGFVRGVDADGADVGPGVCAAGEGVDAAAD
jgi:hypothetical protein